MPIPAAHRAALPHWNSYSLRGHRETYARRDGESAEIRDAQLSLTGLAADEATAADIRRALKSDIPASFKTTDAIRVKEQPLKTADPFVTNDPELLPVEEVIARSDLLILCQPHTMWRGLDLGGKPLIDIWGAMKPDVGLAKRRHG